MSTEPGRDDQGRGETESEDAPRARAGADGGYVHRPSEVPNGDEDTTPGGPGAAPTGAGDPSGSGEADLGRAGWVLVGVVVLSFLVVPGAIYLFPAAPGDAGLSFLVAMLVLPFLPAVLLGAAAVWSVAAACRR